MQGGSLTGSGPICPGADWRMLLMVGVGRSVTNCEVDAMGLPGFRYDEVLGPVGDDYTFCKRTP